MVVFPLHWMFLSTTVECPQHQIGHELGYDESSYLAFPMIMLMYMYACGDLYMWLVEDQTLYDYGVTW